VGTTACREASQVCTQRTPIQKEKPWAVGQIDSFAFARNRRQNLNGEVLYMSKGLLHCAGEKRMRAYNLYCKNHSRYTLSVPAVTPQK